MKPRVKSKGNQLRGLFYLTFNGVYHSNNGIASQTRTLLGTISQRFHDLQFEFGEFAFYIVSPEPYYREWGFNVHQLESARSIAENTGGQVHLLPFGSPLSNFWSVPSWSQLCSGAAEVVRQHSAMMREAIVLAVDTPFLQTGYLLEEHAAHSHVDIRTVHCPYSSSVLLRSLEPQPQREIWEERAYHAIRSSKRTYVGDVCAFMTSHIQKTYGLSEDSFVPFRSSIDLDSPEFILDSESTLRATLLDYNIPCDRPLLLAFGRAHPVKGFDLLARALQNFPVSNVYVVLVLVPYPGDSIFIEEIRTLLAESPLDFILVEGYDRRLPRAVAQWPLTKVVCCPSRVETLPNVPLEVAIWARNGGPIIVASTAGGIPEVVINGETGYTFPVGDVTELRIKLLDAFTSDRDAPLDQMRRHAYERVITERNQYVNLGKLLRRFWSSN